MWVTCLPCSDVIKPAEILKAGILKKLADCADLPIQIKDLKKKLKKQIQDEKNAEKARNGVIAFYNQSIAAEATAASTMQSSGKRKNPFVPAWNVELASDAFAREQ